MKISTNLLTAGVVTIFVVTIITTISQAAPIVNFRMKTADFKGVQKCLYNVSESSNKNSLCYRLLHPSLNDTFTARELPLRHVFYSESAIVWNLFVKWSNCSMRTFIYNSEQCKPRLADYAGHYLKDFKADTYDLVTRFKEDWFHANPMVDILKHCLHLHGSDSNLILPLYSKKCSPYVHLNRDNIQQTYARLIFYIYGWLNETILRHGYFPMGNAHQQREIRDEEAIYNCLYSPSSRDSDDQKDFCRSIVNPMASAKAFDFSSSNGVSLQGLNRTEKHYIEFVKGNIVYDCLRNHRTERVYGCKDVMKRVSCTWAKDGSHHDPIIDTARKYVQQEEEQELKFWEKAALTSPFKILPKRLAKLCELYSINGEEVTTPRPKDCEEGGLYYPFL